MSIRIRSGRCFAQALAERRNLVGGRRRHLGLEIPDHLHRRLLRLRPYRPRSRTAQNTEKISPLHVRPRAQEAASYRLKRVI